MLKRLHIFILLCLMVGLSTAQVRKIKINSIVIEGNRTAEASMIRLNSGLMVGQEITGEDLQRAVKNLWSIQIFSDIQVYVTDQAQEGYDLLIKVEEYPRLRKIELVGNNEFDKDDIEKEIAVYRGMKISPFRIFKINQTLKKMYMEEGYLLADIKLDTVKAETGFVDLQIDINEGEEIQVKRITFHDNEAFDDDDLRGAMDEIKEDRWWRSGDFEQNKFEQDKEKILNYCRENGYRDAHIVKDSIYYSEDKKDLFIDIWIYEGEEYFFGDITFDGNTIFSDEELAYSLGIEQGDSYNQKKYIEGVTERLQKDYYNQGYLFSQVQPLELPIGKDTLNVNFKITEGNVVSVKEINIMGNTKTHEKVLRREFRLQPGEVFNSSKLERSVRDITILNYFSNIIPNVIMLENDPKNVNLEFTVEEKSTDMANMSAGFSQRDGLIGSLGLAFNNFSMTHPFTGGDGQRLVFDWQFGRIYRSISLSFTEPWLFNTPTLAGFSIFNTRTGGGFYPWDRRDLGGSIHLGRRFHWPDNFFRGDWIFRFSQSTISNIRDPELLSRYTNQGGFEDVRQISLTQIISRDSRDQPEFPTKGSVNSLSFQFSGGPLGGEADYIKSIFNAEWFVPLPLKFVLYSKIRYGVIEVLHRDAIILFGEYFYLGGSGLGFSESLRGYDDGQVGPLSSAGSPIGGKSMVKNSIEIRFPISPNPTIFGLFFVEGGNSWAEIYDMDPFDLRRSIGGGLRLFMPMLGIIGIDFGYGFDHFNAFGKREGQWKVHFQFGKF